MHHFCTYFDHRYLTRGIALYESLQNHAGSFTLWILCLDDKCHKALIDLDLEFARPISLQEMERGDTLLLQAKGNRTVTEYYFTCTSSFLLFVLEKNNDVDFITYLDADLFFFSDPAPLFQQMEGKSVGIIAHHFAPGSEHRELYGIYNVGWVSFRRDSSGLECLRWWREKCLEWCYDRVEDGRFADQKYLDCWPTRFRDVVVLDHHGANLAPWNIGNYTLKMRKHRITAGGMDLIFFHFHELRQITEWLYISNLENYGVEPSSIVLRIYLPYVKVLTRLSKQFPYCVPSCVTHLRETSLAQTHRQLAFPLLGRFGWYGRIADGIITGGYLVGKGGFYALKIREAAIAAGRLRRMLGNIYRAGRSLLKW